jgi:hypothetical protein
MNAYSVSMRNPEKQIPYGILLNCILEEQDGVA